MKIEKNIILDIEKANLEKRIEKLKQEIKYKQDYLSFTENFLNKLCRMEDKIELLEIE